MLVNHALRIRPTLTAALFGLILGCAGSTHAQTPDLVGNPSDAGDVTPAVVEVSPELANSLVFREGEPVPFLGIFTHAKTVAELDEKLDNVLQLCEVNPYIKGVALKIRWYQLHPEPDVFYLDKVEELVEALASRGKIVHISLIPGFGTPSWVYEAGAQRIGPITSGRITSVTPLPWDPKFKELFTKDLRALAERFGDDPRVTAIGMAGHNYKSEEMHTPSDPKDLELLKQHGMTRELVLEDWKGWIDLYGELFPNKKLILVLSQMYGEEGLPDEVAEYFVDHYAGRAILQTDQLNGRAGGLLPSGEVCKHFSDRAPNGHEMVGSFQQQPERQGNPEMVIYNSVLMGNTMYLQLWQRDCEDPKYAEALLAAWDRYHNMDPALIKAELEAQGKFLNNPSWEWPEKARQPKPWQAP